jgi:hypothetical protein
MSIVDLHTAASRWVDDHREGLYRYALVRVRKPKVACLEVNWFDIPAGGKV